MTIKKIETKLIYAGRKKTFLQGSVNPIVQRASSVIFETLKEKKQVAENIPNNALFYGRRGTQTHFALQKAMCEIENGAGCSLYSCGAAAIANSILAFVKAGDDILMTEAAYESTQHFCNQVLKDLNVSTTYYDPCIGDKISTLIKPNTKVVFLESPSSITMEIQNIPDIVKAIRNVSKDIVIIIDNTWAAGVLFPALEMGIDISIQSGTKYLIGHSDYMLGTAVSNARCWEQLRERSYLLGQMVDADTAYMAQRGLRTLKLRLSQHEKASIQIAKWLESREEVTRVNHPALASFKGHDIYLRDFKGCNGLFSFVLNKKLSNQEMALFLDGFALFSMAFSWGGYESLILAFQPEELKLVRSVNSVDFEGTLIRLHIGLENVDDLIEDLEKSFQRIYQ